ncbi:MAG: bifunctional UDP-2,4-diacetamido-2,4,6-trideoxy-beta-L-altropyranose hydrolase/GNAT family N-acetyltransferase, partial [Crocinitomicaceae bacterium]|nr:bifunctional UDP-2,4-diacetamido-2,4,6-trideoxy-beta-L-altropyranose hydrolase/GNAT family N-acetyltransferase [Crocinitomicaceae bacterium]
RSPFIELAQEKEKTKTKNSLLICFGGSDPLNKTEIAVNAALNSSIEFSEINIVLGPGYKNQLQINELAEGTNRAQVHIAIDASEMAALMARNEYAIIPCSSIFLEALTADMKILSGYYVDNQKYVYDYYLKNNWFADAKSFTETDIKTALPELTKRSISINVIDGKSMGRIKKVIQLLARENASTMRRAVLEDIRTTFEWANLPETRLYSLNKDDIPWINHEKWFIKKIASENCWYGILEHDSKLRGSIRFDIEDGIALISYLVDPQAYRMGFGTLLLKMGIDGLLREKESIREIHGVVMEENFASMKTFEKFGFELSSSNGMPLYIKKLT